MLTKPSANLTRSSIPASSFYTTWHVVVDLQFLPSRRLQNEDPRFQSLPPTLPANPQCVAKSQPIIYQRLILIRKPTPWDLHNSPERRSHCSGTISKLCNAEVHCRNIPASSSAVPVSMIFRLVTKNGACFSDTLNGLSLIPAESIKARPDTSTRRSIQYYAPFATALITSPFTPSIELTLAKNSLLSFFQSLTHLFSLHFRINSLHPFSQAWASTVDKPTGIISKHPPRQQNATAAVMHPHKNCFAMHATVAAITAANTTEPASPIITIPTAPARHANGNRHDPGMDNSHHQYTHVPHCLRSYQGYWNRTNRFNCFRTEMFVPVMINGAVPAASLGGSPWRVGERVGEGTARYSLQGSTVYGTYPKRYLSVVPFVLIPCCVTLDTEKLWIDAQTGLEQEGFDT